MDWLAAVAQGSPTLAVALFALWLLREEGRRNAAALRRVLDDHLTATREHAAALAALAELIRSHHPRMEA